MVEIGGGLRIDSTPVMAKFTKAFSIIALVCAVIGFSGLGGPIVGGLFKALMGVSLIMLIISALFGKELA